MPNPTVDRELPSRVVHSRGALAHSLSATAWRQALEFRPADPTIAVALRVGFAAAIVLIGGGLLGYPQLAGFAALGALCSAFSRYEPYPLMAVKLTGVAAGVVLSAVCGALLGAFGLSIWTQIVVLSLLAGICFWLLSAFRITGPGAAIMIFAAAGAAGFAENAADVRGVTVAVTVGAVIGWLTALAPRFSHPHSPARVAVARALAAVSAVEKNGPSAVPAARQAIAGARMAISLTPSSRVNAHTHELLAFVEAAEATLDSGSHDTLAARRTDFLRLEAELRRVRPELRTPRSGEIAQVDTAKISAERPTGLLRDGLRQLGDRNILIGVARVTVAAILAGGVAAAMGLHHPLWATIGAMTALQGANYQHTVQRAIQRLLGNAIGAVLATGLFVLDLGFWPVVAVVVVCTTLTEMYVTRNYALASVFITTTALLITGISEPTGAEIAATRVGDTLIGVVIGVVVAALTINRHDRHHLPG